jgi:hypothetical protein
MTTTLQPVVIITAPTSWAPALINGDRSGYDDHELQQIDAACDDMTRRYGNALPVDCQDIGFRWRAGDYGKLGGEYSEYAIIPSKEVPQ